ncbi:MULTISPECIES: hypothetical protein [Microbacterium]|uniref:DUF306 domain-containing protein n=1 Tax=Microbacterium schleiferi TaxID=69362 RepID=A0ABU7V8R4_9MICO
MRSAPENGMRALGVAMVFTALAASIVGCASTEPAAPEVIAQRATASGISPDLVYVTAVDGYDLAPQSVGRTGADGMSASWFNAQTGGILTVRTDRGTLTPQTCPEMPLWDTLDGGITCSNEGDIWHRFSGSVEEYMVARDGVLILVTGRNLADRADLEAAAKAVRLPSDAELDLLFSDLPDGPAQPIERGDLPENGDGAPIDPSSPGG